MSEEPKLVIQLRLPATDVETELASTLPGVTLSDQRPLDASEWDPDKASFVAAVAIVGTITLSWLAKRLVDDWLKSREQGVLLDLRQAPPVISRVAGVPRGFVVTIQADGKATRKKVDYEKSEDIVAWLASALPHAK